MKSASPVRVFIVDDHPFMRIGIAAIVQTQEDLTVCGQAGSLQEALELFEQSAPDIVLMDLRLPDGNGVQAIKHMRGKQPSLKILVLTTYEGDEDIFQALQAGAMGYLIKGMPHDSLLDAIRTVIRGNHFLPPPVKRTLSMRSPDSDLSSREREVLRLMVAGRSNREIGEELNIKESTVKSHVSVILMRLQVNDRTQAVVEALKRGLEHL